MTYIEHNPRYRRPDPTDYRALKKMLNPYHQFSFPMPRKGLDFTPQQKSAITRQWKRLERSLRAVRRDKASFIRFREGAKSALVQPHYTKTNIGFFFPRPGAKLAKERGKWVIKVVFKQRIDTFIPLPKPLYTHAELIPLWLEAQYELAFPAQFSISVKGYKGSFGWTPFDGLKYFSDAFSYFSDEGSTKNAIDGIYVSHFTPAEFDDIYNLEEEDVLREFFERDINKNRKKALSVIKEIENRTTRRKKATKKKPTKKKPANKKARKKTPPKKTTRKRRK